MDVPEPSTVTLSGAGGMVKTLTNHYAEPGQTPGRFLRAALGFGFRGLGGNCLIDL